MLSAFTSCATLKLSSNVAILSAVYMLVSTAFAFVITELSCSFITSTVPVPNDCSAFSYEHVLPLKDVTVISTLSVIPAISAV